MAIFSKIGQERLEDVLRAMKSPDKRASRDYLHWDKLRHLDPPGDLTSEEWWLAVKLARNAVARQLPLLDPQGRPFSYSTPDEALRALHVIDQECAGAIAMPEVVVADGGARNHYLVNSLMEEAIRSSQLEGATTARRVAKELLESGRAPKDRSEQMVLNNYRAINFMRDNVDGDLLPRHVLELHRIVTEGTLDDPDAAGRLQTTAEERVVVLDSTTGELIHSPPPAEQLPGRLAELCDFANGGAMEGAFLHPVVRAILVHFWLAYDHPFEDGNGRTARALFYWSMRRQGYWVVEYLSISHILRRAPAQYARSFLFTETDDRDTTYFILAQLAVIERAIAQFRDYVTRKVAEVRAVEGLLGVGDDLNHRQVSLLGDAVKQDGRSHTFAAHARRYGVTHQTARNDLLDLMTRGLLERRKAGRTHLFYPVPDLAERLGARRGPMAPGQG